jgi:peptidoglycan/LPS O-acetylase OafA/YrhL
MATDPGETIEYRPEIDGLRGIAVIVVVWFHSGLPGMPGGFVGVDVFFVISGYLITSIIHRGLAAGKFSFRHFYERRFRRIAPALVTVTAVTTIASYVLLLPYELEAFANSAAATIAMVSNIYFWRTLNYFAPAHGLTPLLHGWSLGVEEQFYLLFPATLVIAERFGKARPAIAALGIGSFVLCLAMTASMPAATFYLLPTRGWELMVGASLAVGLVSIPAPARQLAAVVGVALTIAASVGLGPHEPFPGWRALLPTIGAALVIGAGAKTVAARALSFRPIVYVGRISYSFYLWHWPIFVFLRHWRADPDLPPALALAGIAAAFIISAVSYRWIEQPARNNARPFRHVLLPSIATAAAVLGASAIAIAGQGLPQRLPPRVDAIAARHNDFAPLAHTCVDVGPQAALERCHVGPPGPPAYLLWGDSHAAAIAEAVVVALGRPGVLVSMSACPPVLGWIGEDSDPKACPAANRQALRLALQDPRIDTVILSAFWSAADREGGAGFWRSVQAVADRLNAAGKRVIVVAGVPDPTVDVPWTSAIRERFGRPQLRLRCPIAHVPLRGVTVVDVSSGFCREPPYLVFQDSNHPSRFAGLTIIAPAIREAVRSGD